MERIKYDKIVDFKINGGELYIDSDRFHGKESLNKLVEITLVENLDFFQLSFPKIMFLERNYRGLLLVKNGVPESIVLNWLDGYSNTVVDLNAADPDRLIEEHKENVAWLTERLGEKTGSVNEYNQVWKYAWGDVFERYDIRSLMVLTVINFR